MNIRNQCLIITIIFFLYGCSKYDTSKFVFPLPSEKYSDSIKMLENSDLRIILKNPIISYPDKRYKLGANTEISFDNLGTKDVIIDSIQIDQYFKDSNISDSVRVWLTSQNRYSFPIELCPNSDGFPCNGINLIYYIDNSNHDFQIEDTIRVETNIWFRIGSEKKTISRIDNKVFRRFQGYYTL